MEIEYLGHSSFFLKGNEKSVVTDPFDGVGYAMKRVECDYCLVSHEHFDHCYTDGVKCRKIIRNSEDGFVVIDSYHDHNLGALRGKNRIFLKRSGMGNRGTFSGTGESQWKKLGLQHSGRTFCEGRSEADSA